MMLGCCYVVAKGFQVVFSAFLVLDDCLLAQVKMVYAKLDVMMLGRCYVVTKGFQVV